MIPVKSNFGLTWLLFVFVAVLTGKVDSTGGFELGIDSSDDVKSPLQYQYDNYLNSVKRAAGFVGMRGKKSLFAADADSDDVINEEDIEPYVLGQMGQHRATRAGFVGMRGKKEDEGYDKRAGFVGMRGKKLSDFFPYWFTPSAQQQQYQQHQQQQVAVPQSHYMVDSFEPSKIRRASSGFVGMRG